MNFFSKLIREFPTIKFKNNILSNENLVFLLKEKRKHKIPKKMQIPGIIKESFNECCKKFKVNSKFFKISPKNKHIKVSNMFLIIGFFLLFRKKSFSENESNRTQQNRIEYEAVKMNPQINKKNNVIFLILFFIKKKRIISLEKNPEKKKKPIILKRLNKMENERNSDLIITFLNKRLSWLWLLKIIQYPILIKSRALKTAWIIRCRKPTKGLIRQHLVIIKPRCLKVERAITFFRSFSKRANIPANNKVIIPLIINMFITKFLLAINKKNRITR